MSLVEERLSKNDDNLKVSLLRIISVMIISCVCTYTEKEI